MFYRWFTLFLSALLFISCDSDIETPDPQSDIVPSAPTFIQQCPNYLYQNTSRMRYIPGGAFTMGGAYETDHHKTPEWTARTDAFYMDAHEVTIGDYLFFMEQTGHEVHWSVKIPHHAYGDIENDFEYESHPVQVSWYDAVAYTTWVGKRLPTEVEWEKAARGGVEGAAWSWGNASPTRANRFDPKEAEIQTRRGTMAAEGAFVIARLSGTPRFPWDDGFMFLDRKEGFFELQPVMSYKPNPYGIFDMIGNVNEWCSDDWNINAYLLLMNGIKPNPQQIDWDNGGQIDKVSRGGGIRHNTDMVSKYSQRIGGMEDREQAQFLRSTIHVGERTGTRPFRAVGFRCVLDTK